MTPEGFRHITGAIGPDEQAKLVDAILDGVRSAPFFVPRMPRTGKPFSVLMTNFGRLGWVSDQAGGYRYQETHPETGARWPSIPPFLIDLWCAHATVAGPPEACLVNLYRNGAKMGSHRDADEHEPRAPVLSISLGDEAVFHIGGAGRRDPKFRVVLASGDVVVLGGAARFAYHGIDRVRTGTSTLVPGGGRLNLTLRRVTPF